VMQPANSKHGPVSDEVLAKEARGTIQSNRGSRIEDWRDPEPSGGDEPSADHFVGTQDTAGRRAVVLRSDIAAALRRSLFPASRAELLEHVDSVHASDEIRGLVAALPEKRKFRNVEDVWEQLGGENPDAQRF
jgi:hypothetical protein